VVVHQDAERVRPEEEEEEEERVRMEIPPTCNSIRE
jgi:hypothetical protein